MADEENTASKGASAAISRNGDYDRVALTEAVDWMDDPSEDADGGGEDDGAFFADEEPSHASLSSRQELLSVSSRNNSSSFCSQSFWTTCLLSDDRFSICGINLLDGPPAVKLLKFQAVTFAGICLMYKFVRLVVRM